MVLLCGPACEVLSATAAAEVKAKEIVLGPCRGSCLRLIQELLNVG